MTRRLFRVGLLCVAAASSHVCLKIAAQQPPPVSKAYIFSQASCPPGNPAQAVQVPLGASIQVQLPGNRAPNGKWEFVAPFPGNVKLISSKVIDSKDRIPGLDSIYIFNFIVTSRGAAIITMRATPAISVTYPNLKIPDQVKCPQPQSGTAQTYKLETLKYYLNVPK